MMSFTTVFTNISYFGPPSRDKYQSHYLILKIFGVQIMLLGQALSQCNVHEILISYNSKKTWRYTTTREISFF